MVTCTTEGASRWQILKTRLWIGLGRFLNRRGVPGLVQPMCLNDSVTGMTIKVSNGVLFTKISFGPRDYYFGRFTGRFDGTGQSMCSSAPSSNAAEN